MRNIPTEVKLDSIDRAILTELQRAGRISNQDLAQRVHLSASACLRRVKALEERGVISQYVALVNPRAVGKHGISYTIINLESMNTPQLEAFEQAVRDQPEVLDCFYVAGSNDYLIRFAYRDAEDLERFHSEVLMRLPGVARSNSLLPTLDIQSGFVSLPPVTSRIASELARTSYMDRWSDRTSRKLIDELACGSRSTSSVLRPRIARAAARLMAVVVFPTPPFWFATAMTFMGRIG